MLLYFLEVIKGRHPLIIDFPSPSKDEGKKRVEGEGKIHRGFPVLLFGPLVEPFRGDGHGGFFLRVIFDLSLLSSCFSLLGVYKGATPLYSTFRHA